MLVAAAVCPHPPLIVPELAAGAAGELDALRAACDAAVADLLAARPDRVVAVGTGPETAEFPKGGAGSFSPYGVNLSVRLGAGGGDIEERLPLSLTIAAWLLGRTPVDVPVSGLAVAHDADAVDCLASGAELVSGDERVALLVMGDGTACRTEKAPGYLDARAEPYDAAAALALANADVLALAALDPRLSEELGVSGRAAWQLLAGAADGADLTGRLTYDEAPYGVGYFVAVWS
ncbi:class III extradiol dioxygenase subunit B-like domain-containing protein [Yinghuangia sp. ASG 101]|uniref:class III extradiol dioxygenase subunit B-like domain-containing protein n=1 Tax=Yinghuangia sp. ASG 101 TaxID=2896848 RepID=UPI001E2AB5C8|nr:class III extradiol dioxygenase subunit B-like domain-containing protein [Yinghuangia sp. ASG 101]UGQ13914.1 class III extradiol dioxygenase subunit B-like domain-containing protein [Yinghuangia sp. ASG 101]